MNKAVCVSNPAGQALAGGFDRYLNYVYSLPILSEQEEKALFEQYQATNDLQAVRKLVLSHLRFVAYLAREYRGYGLPMEDLVQEGSIGLMKSVKKFDLSFGVRLATYAMHWIKAEMQEYILKNWQLVKVATTKAQRKLFFNLRSMKKRLGWMSADEVEEVANYLNVTPDDVRHMEMRMSGSDSSLDESFREGEVDENKQYESDKPSLCHELLGENPLTQVEDAQFHLKVTELIKAVVNGLDDRAEYIFRNRWLVPEENKLGLKALAERFDISIERVRQLELKVMREIRTALAEEGITQTM